MSNPYYISPNNNRAQNFFNLANLGLQLYGMKQRGDIAETEAGINQERNRLTREEIRQRGAISAEENRLKGEQVATERMKIPYHKQNWGRGDDALLRAHLNEFGIDPKDDTNPIVQKSKEFANTPGITKMDTYEAFRSDDSMRESVLQSMEAKIQKGLAKNPNYTDTPEGKKAYQTMQFLSSEEGWGKAVDSVFMNTVKSAKMEEDNTRAALEAARAANRPVYPTFDQVVAGQVLGGQRTAEEAATLVHPQQAPRPTVVPAQASLVMPGERTPTYTNPNKTGTGSGLPDTAAGGSDPLEGLTKAQQETVKAIAEYRFPVTNLRNKEMMALVQRAYAYDPSFDAKEYAVRAGVRKDFASGKAAVNIRSLNTAVAHLDSLSKAAKGLNNGSITLWNEIKNYGLTKVGDPRVKKFNTSATAVSGELATVFKSTSGTDQEIKEWRQNMDTAGSPEQIQAFVDQGIELLGGRLRALQMQYQTGLGKAKDFRFLSEPSLKILRNLGVDIESIDPVAGAKEAPATDNSDMSQFWKKNG